MICIQSRADNYYELLADKYRAPDPRRASTKALEDGPVDPETACHLGSVVGDARTQVKPQPRQAGGFPVEVIAAEVDRREHPA
jgi:hypothetical protein